MPAAGQE